MYLFHSSHFEGGLQKSRSLLKQSIHAYLALTDTKDVDVDELMTQLKTNPNGKPYIEGFAHFSVSHSGKYWAVLFDDQDPCGLDIQLEKEADYEAIAKKLYSEHEIEEVQMYGQHAFFHIWTRREAFVKALGGSVFSETPELIFPEYDCSMEISYQGEVWQIRDIEMPMKIYAAVCTKRFDQIKPYALEFATRFVREEK